MRKVKITKLPKAADGGSSSSKKTYGIQTPPQDAASNPAMGGYHGGATPEIKINKTLQPTEKENATLEAELGETVVTNLQQEGIPEFYKIGGKRHYNGGTPLNLPPNSFIFSRDKKMEIKDPDTLDMFGKTPGKKKKSYTPADLSKTYDINHYREILANPFSDKMQIKTAELMIKNYNNKLGALALAQESIKGFDNGIPDIAMNYLQEMNIDPSQLVMPEGNPAAGMMSAPMPQMQQGAPQGAPAFKGGGQLKKYEPGGSNKRKPLYGYDERFSEKGILRLNALLYQYGLPQLQGQVSESQILEAADKLQKETNTKYSGLVKDYMLNWSHQPNVKLQGMIPEGYEKTNEGLRKAYEDGKITDDQILEGYNDKKWWYRGLETNVKEISQEEYDEKIASGKGIKQGESLFFHDDPNNPELYTEYKVKAEEDPVDDKKDDDVKRPTPEYMGQPAEEDPYAFWLQDKNNIAASLAGYLGVNKHRPWNAPVGMRGAQPQFADFRQAAANINSGLAGVANQAAMVGNPQAYNANLAAAQRNATQGINQVQDAEFKTNTGIANQFNMYNSQVANQNQAAQAQNATNLYDKNTIANQQYDNAKAAYRDLIRQNVNQAFTNASQTQIMNSMHDAYSVNPTDGGSMTFKPNFTLTGKQTTNQRSILEGFIGEYGVEQGIKAYNALYNPSKTNTKTT